MLWTTRSAVAVRETTFSVALLRAALPRPSGSAPVSCRYTGHASSQVFTIRTLPPRAHSGTPTAVSARKPSAGVDDVASPPPPQRPGVEVVRGQEQHGEDDEEHAHVRAALAQPEVQGGADAQDRGEQARHPVGLQGNHGFLRLFPRT